MKKRSTIAIGVFGLAVCTTAQVTTDSLTVGGTDAIGCQNSTNPPTLDDGLTVATARFEFSYDSSTGVLTLTAENTSPVLTGVPNPALCDIYFNTPLGLTSAQLLSATQASGNSPGHQLASNVSFGCVRDFDLGLTIQNIQGCIGNANADTLPGPPNALAIGPVAFQIQFSGPGTGSTNARDFTNATNGTVQAGARFQGGGANAAFSGGFGTAPCVVNNVVAESTNYGAGIPGCNGVPDLFMTNRPLIGSAPEIFLGNAGMAASNCALLWSFSDAEIPIPMIGGDLLVALPVVLANPFSVPSGGFTLTCNIPSPLRSPDRICSLLRG